MRGGERRFRLAEGEGGPCCSMTNQKKGGMIESRYLSSFQGGKKRKKVLSP